VQWMKPLGINDYNHVQMKAFCVFSGSGKIVEKSPILAFLAIIPRDIIKRPEASASQPILAYHCVTNTPEGLVSLILGVAKLSNAWDGILTKDLT